MKTQFLIYLWSISEDIKFLLTFTGFFGAIFSLIGAVATTDACFKSYSNVSKWWLLTWLLVPMFVFQSFIGFLIPLKNDLALIWAYPYISKTINKEQFEKLPNNILKYANNYLEETTKSLKKER